MTQGGWNTPHSQGGWNTHIRRRLVYTHGCREAGIHPRMQGGWCTYHSREAGAPTIAGRLVYPPCEGGWYTHHVREASIPTLLYAGYTHPAICPGIHPWVHYAYCRS